MRKHRCPACKRLATHRFKFDTDQGTAYRCVFCGVAFVGNPIARPPCRMLKEREALKLLALENTSEYIENETAQKHTPAVAAITLWPHVRT